MKVANLSGLGVETATAMKRNLSPARRRCLVKRDALMALAVYQHGWKRRDLQEAFGLTKMQVCRIMNDIEALRISVISIREDAA